MSKYTSTCASVLGRNLDRKEGKKTPFPRVMAVSEKEVKMYLGVVKCHHNKNKQQSSQSIYKERNWRRANSAP